MKGPLFGAVTALVALPGLAAAQEATLDEVIATLDRTLSVTEPQTVEEIPVQSLTFAAVPTGAGCDITYSMVFDAGDPPSSGTIDISTAALDAADMEVEPSRAGGNGVLSIHTRPEADGAAIALLMTPENEIYAGMRGAIEAGQIDGACTEESCTMTGTEDTLSMPIAPNADPADVAAVLDTFGALITLCATAPAAG